MVAQPIPKSLCILLLAILLSHTAKMRASDPLHTAINGPCQMAIDAAGNLYVNEEYGHRILRINWKKKEVDVVAGNGKECCFRENELAWKTSVYDVYSLALDPQANLYLGGRNRANGAFVRVVDRSTGRIRSVANGREPISPDGMPAMDADLSDLIRWEWRHSSMARCLFRRAASMRSSNWGGMPSLLPGTAKRVFQGTAAWCSTRVSIGLHRSLSTVPKTCMLPTITITASGASILKRKKSRL